MSEMEENAFRLVYQFYAKWRETIIETDEQWQQFAAEVGELGRQVNIDHCAVGFFLIEGVLNAFNAMYAGGMKPMPAGYFGRDDLST